MKKRLCIILALLSPLVGVFVPAAERPYDPLVVPDSGTSAPVDLVIEDEDRQRRIPVRIYPTTEKFAVPLVLFSHGLGGSRETCGYLGRHWAARGYTAVFLQHPGSDSSIWKSVPPAQRMTELTKAASLQNLMLRISDVSSVLDQLEVWNETSSHMLEGMLDMKRIGMSGHSFGAVTTQALSGQTAGRGYFSLADARIRAAIVFSPSNPRRGGDPKQAFGSVKIPWMLMTGTNDLSIIGNADMESRLAVYPALPPGQKYEVVLYRAEHSAFTERALPGDKEPRNPNHHRAILALSTAFWDACLRDDQSARTWLNGDGPETVLEQNDRWQRK